ncbi:hypothetical protein BaRGS_00035140 [Batillaria attramentaria]|uniref:Uncharacterized protein n=1 Tax=Batillaria attramentaria TaxID=370345 RepID=A0ABD0JFH5_9CAEN
MAASKKYTLEEDHDLMDEVSLYNPFKKINSWEGLKKKLDEHPLLGRRSSKSLRDRALLIMDQRRTLVKQQEKASGIEEPERSDFDKAIDEALLIKQEAEEEQASSCSKKRRQDAADIAVLAAAEAGRAPAAPDLDVQPSSSTPDVTSTPTAKYRRTSGELVGVLKTKVEAEKAAREEERQERQRLEEARQEEAARLQRAAEEDRQLRREELNLKKRELDLREAQEKAMAKEKEAMMQLLMQQLSKK